MSDFVFSREAFQPGNVFNANERFMVRPKSPAPIDKEVSKIVGKEIRTTDSRLLKLVVKWKKEAGRGDNEITRDDYLFDAKKMQELKDAFK